MTDVFIRYTVYGTTVTDELCEYLYRCTTEKQAIHLAGLLNAQTEGQRAA